ncbi:SusC/RagA family TonB-linked outer membrane protein [Dyadobacter pollutisoli]|uniref:SusC/RagA family TonB-linked outer membrane protein n=1 Tax=Dyadobacter pollutisoli TaxID=2910158 RepID=A0A9E8SMM9_9BACT|nr:SusC/RagA family TonB-linked outer membrane protein [Dyadobacter pollutisoli]WAC14925.1 SusC/RagA family TonB-linked outer membrane protein [Dyadobacter pollutisoli]
MCFKSTSFPALGLVACLAISGQLATSMPLFTPQDEHSVPKSTANSARPLTDVLKDLKLRFGVDILYGDQLVEGITVPGDVINQKKNLEENLKSILKNTGLQYRKVKDGAYLISGQRIEKKLTTSVMMISDGLGATPGSEGAASAADLNPLRLNSSKADQVVSGRVTSEVGEGLPGVNVLLKGSTRGISTDVDGRYQLGLPESGDHILVYSLVGYTSQEVAVGNRSVIDVQLLPDDKTLEEIVVVGYGTVKKSDITGSVGSVSAKELTAYPTMNAVQGLQGRSPGVQVMQNSGEPGTTLSVRIRGGNSLQGSNEPLYVVDGFALSGPPNAISPNEIESMEVLKDASATAIYGSRGANGVILITTKQGKVGKPQVTIDSYYAVQQVNKKLDLMNAQEFATLANERAVNDGVAPYFTSSQISGFGQGTDWQDVIFRKAPMQNHALSVAGGSENTQYALSGNFFGQQGIIRGSNYNRESFRANLNQRLGDKVRLMYNAVLTNTNRSQLLADNGQKGSTIVSAALGSPPTITPRNEAGNYSFIKPYAFSPNSLENPLALAEARKQKNNEIYILSSMALSYQPVKNLTLRSSVGIENSSMRGDLYSPSVITTTPNGSANITYANRFNLLNENTATYIPKLAKDHELTLLGGVTYQQENSRSFSASATGFNYEGLGSENIGVGSNPGIPTSTSYKWVLFSYLARANYAFKSRYLFTASMRADGSSRFGANNKWGYFPSAAFGWRVIDEPFAQNLRTISDLKLRLSYGVTGNTALSPYQTLFTLSPINTVYNDQLYVGQLTTAQLTNPNLKWESTAQFNAGLDLAILRNRFSLTFDYYLKNTRDLLATVPLQQSTGYTSTIQNIGQIRNRGIELGLNANIINSKSVKWDLNLNITRNRSEVLKLAGGSDVFGTALQQPLSVAVNLIRVGQPIGVFYGYLEDGLNEKGAIKYKDLNADNVLTLADKTIIGDPNPDFLYNFGSNMSYKDFSLNMFWLGKQGGDIFNANLTNQASSMYFGENQIRDVYNNHWVAASPDPAAKYPKISASTSFKESNRFIEDGSFLRLKSIQLAYNIPANRLNIKWVRSAQLYVSGQNLVTFTKYSWYDPEVNTLGGANSISMGIDQTGYPTAKTYTVGARLGF